MKLKALLLGAATSVVLTGIASADYHRDGWYLGLEAGWARINETDINNESLTFNDGMAGFVTIGHAFKNSNWRIEGELGYRNNEVDELDKARLTTEGEMEEWSGMVNALYDFHLNSERWGLSLGAGAGIDNARYKSPVDGHDSNDKVFAWQGIAGLTYRVNPHWDIMLNYRYFNADMAEVMYSAVDGPYEVDLEKHTVTVGFRWGYTEPKIDVPPTTCEQRGDCPKEVKDFIVFFGWNKCNITAEADQVLSEAAAAAKRNGSANVRIVGHTDTSGSNSYNQKLSECRANAVKANLEGKGVDAGRMSASGRGESEPQVATGDGVKEPQNRRATVHVE